MPMLKKLLKLSFALLFFVFLSTQVFASEQNYDYPSPLWGLTTVVTNPGDPALKMTFYSQADGSEILRDDSATTAGDLNFKYGPYCTILGRGTDCFALSGIYSGKLKLLTSRTYVNGSAKTNTAVLREIGVNVIGDSFNADSNFAYWGRYLKQNTGSADSNALWKTGSYQFNPNSQAYWKSDDPNKNTAMTSAINRLKLNSKPANTFLALGNSWVNPIFDGVCGSGGVSCSDSNQYSDGRVWYAAPTGGWGLFANTSSVIYSRKATFVIESGNPLVREDVQIDRSFTSADNNSSIGFIVTNGDVYIQNLNPTERLTIKANVFVPNGTIHTFGNNIDFTGSFVAQNFDVTGSGINFIQDTRPESTWPPGFRDLLPLKSESK